MGAGAVGGESGSCALLSQDIRWQSGSGRVRLSFQRLQDAL